MLVNFVRVISCPKKKAKHGLSLMISVRLPPVNYWYSGKVSGLEEMVVGFKSRASQFRQSHFLS